MIPAVQFDGSAHEVWVSPVATSPQRVTDYDHSVRPRYFLIQSEARAKRRRDSEEIKEVHRDLRALDSLRLAIPGQIPPARSQGGDRRKCVGRLTPLQVILDASGHAQAPLRYDDLDAIDPFRLRIR